MCILNREACGESEELDMCERALLEKVIPRLLRPLEGEGRTVRPCLVHGDLWDGNVGVVEEEGEERAVVFDPGSFWGHNECLFSFPFPFSRIPFLSFCGLI